MQLGGGVPKEIRAALLRPPHGQPAGPLRATHLLRVGASVAREVTEELVDPEVVTQLGPQSEAFQALVIRLRCRGLGGALRGDQPRSEITQRVASLAGPGTAV